MEYLNFVCRRKSPVTGRKEVKHGIFEPYDNAYDRVWRVEREKELEEEKAARRLAKGATTDNINPQPANGKIGPPSERNVPQSHLKV